MENFSQEAPSLSLSELSREVEKSYVCKQLLGVAAYTPATYKSCCSETVRTDTKQSK